jgi:hypothetical protein
MANIDNLLKLAFHKSANEGEAVNAFLAIRRNLKGEQTVKLKSSASTIQYVETVQYVDRPRMKIVVDVEIPDGVYKDCINSLYHCRGSFRMDISKTPSLFSQKWLIKFYLSGANSDEVNHMYNVLMMNGAKDVSRY